MKIPGIRILGLLQNGRAHDLISLGQALGYADDDGSVDPHTILKLTHALEELRRAGLVIFDTDPQNSSTITGSIVLSSSWKQIYNVLGLSLRDMMSLGPETMVVKPYFGPPERRGASADIFVLMPFKEDLEPIYLDHIKNVAQTLGLSVKRGDDLFTSHAVMVDIWRSIYFSRVIIADCTDRNPNVFYEIGLAHALGKAVILITKNKNDVPFDLKHLRYIKYEYTPRGMKVFENVLAKTLKGSLDHK